MPKSCCEPVEFVLLFVFFWISILQAFYVYFFWLIPNTLWILIDNTNNRLDS